jgi:hypothetical protein
MSWDDTVQFEYVKQKDVLKIAAEIKAALAAACRPRYSAAFSIPRRTKMKVFDTVKDVALSVLAGSAFLIVAFLAAAAIVVAISYTWTALLVIIALIFAGFIGEELRGGPSVKARHGNL